MAEAILSAVIKQNIATPGEITVGDIDQAKLERLGQTYGVKTTTDNSAAINDKDIILLAVKPQILASAAEGIKGKLKTSQLVISILAGKSIKTIGESLSHRCIIRTMPNTPAQIGEGMTVWTATPEVTEEQKKQAAAILGAMGAEIYADDEKYMDMTTAVSGSGPAYVFLFVESMTAAAQKLGFSAEEAEKLVMQTVLGSVHLLQQSGKTPRELRRMVTSPGGTTAEAISAFETGGFHELIEKAVNAAFEKSKILGS